MSQRTITVLFTLYAVSFAVASVVIVVLGMRLPPL